MPTAGYWSTSAYGNSTFVATVNFGTSAATSTDGITWTLITLPASAAWHATTYGNGVFVLVSTSTTAATSTDGITWTLRTLPSASYWYGVAYGNGVFVTAGNGTANAATSTDGITWTARTIPTGNWEQMAFGNGVFVTPGRLVGNAAYSTDGITWATSTIAGGGQFAEITFGNGKFVAAYGDGGSSSSAAVSTNGITWTINTFPANMGVALAYGVPSVPYASPVVNNVYKTATIQANTSEVLEPGIVLAPNNTVVVRGSSTMAFSAYGVEDGKSVV